MRRSPLGLIFTNYDYIHPLLPNTLIEQTLLEAARRINDQLNGNPSLANLALNDKWFYMQQKYEYLLILAPDKPELTYGDVPTIISVLSTWAMQYRGLECDFEIWARPGTGTQRKLGDGRLRRLLDRFGDQKKMGQGMLSADRIMDALISGTILCNLGM
ncbi:MAG: hypothetical protein Q9220_007404 [cf. Caloplaca sp. 1 TL-2023]